MADKSESKLDTRNAESPAIQTTDIPGAEPEPAEVKSAPKSRATGMVKAKDTFASLYRTVIKGQLLPADDPIVVAKPGFFAPYETKR